MKKILTNNRGFTLIELMVVVAIIGILATIAIPNFSKFQGKARQSAAKIELGGIYTAEKAFNVEYNNYHANLHAIGFKPDGFDATEAGDEFKPLNENIRRSYASGVSPDRAGCDTGVAGFATTDTLATDAYTDQCFYTSNHDFQPADFNGVNPKEFGVEDTDGPISTTEFQAVSAGFIGGCGEEAEANLDVWSIDQNKNLVNVQKCY